MIEGAHANLFSFIGGDRGEWEVLRSTAVRGEGLAPVRRMSVVQGSPPTAGEGGWALRGVTSNERYVTRPEKELLVRSQPTLGRPEATCAALIPIRKSPAWWAMTQDERRAVFEEQSSHIAIGLRYLPAIARRLHHGRDLGEPFDFITWFDYAPDDQPRFDELVGSLRASPEWRYVEREVDIRLVRSGPGHG